MRLRYKSNHSESGYMLLILMFFVALLAFTMMATLPKVAQQVKRDREEEMIHRGTEYARAIKKFYKKFNRYPNDLKELENTNNVRFIRRRYKDPMSKDGNWKLLHITDVQQGVSNPNFGVSQAGNFNPAQGGAGQAGGLGMGSSPQAAGNPGAAGGQSFVNAGPDTSSANNGLAAGGTSAGPGGTAAGTDTSGGMTAGTTGDTSGGQSGGTTAPGANPATGGQPGQGGQLGQTYGAGGIVGVQSTSKSKSIREFGGKSNYNKWMFIYDPSQDLGTLLRGPYNPQAFQAGNNANGATGAQTGGVGVTPGTSFGNTFGQPSGGQQQQSNSPGNNMPPDQNAPPQ